MFISSSSLLYDNDVIIDYFFFHPTRFSRALQFSDFII